MRYWLFKSEPDAFGWDDLVARAPGSEEWDGVRNYQARNFMREMSKGDLGFFYHSGKERQIVGIVEVADEAHPDSTDTTGKWDCVDIRARHPLERAVSLDAIKAEPRLSDMALVTQPRLSVQPVAAEEWRLICELSGTPDS